MIMIDEDEEMQAFLRDLRNQKIVSSIRSSETSVIRREVKILPDTYIDALGIQTIYTNRNAGKTLSSLNFTLKNGKAVSFENVSSKEGSIKVNKFLYALRQMAYFGII